MHPISERHNSDVITKLKYVAMTEEQSECHVSGKPVGGTSDRPNYHRLIQRQQTSTRLLHPAPISYKTKTKTMTKTKTKTQTTC